MQKLYNNLLISVTRHVLIVTLILLTHLPVIAQDKTISGTIISADDGTPIPGATILIQGTTTGTITNMDGYFQLDVPGNDAVLVISFVGYQTQEVVVGDQSEIQVSLAYDVTSLDQVVVIGYGAQKKKVITAATVQVRGEDLERRNTPSALQALQGQAAGVSIRSSSGQPGEEPRVNIRGLGTIGNSGPLYIVDGVATGDIKYLNNSDIATIDVLKDAASAAIYGSRAANGVILITTKKGTAGRPQIYFDSYYGFQNRPGDPDLLGARDYAQIMNEQHLNSGGSIDGLLFDLNDLPAYTSEGPADTDWMDEMFVKNAVTQNYSMGLTGGSDQTRYSVSFAYTSQEGIVGGKDYSNYERYNGRINTENSFYDGKLKLGENLTYSYTNRNGIQVGNQYSNTLRSAFNVSPLLPTRNDFGDFFNSNDTIADQFGETYWNNTESNPYANMVYNNQNDRNEQKLIGNIFAKWEPVRNLVINSSFGFDLFSDTYRSFSPEYELSIYAIRSINSATQSMSRSQAFQFDNFANYTLQFDKQRVEIMAGMSSRDYQGSYIYGQNALLTFDDFNRAWLSNANNEESNLITLNGEPHDRDKLLSYFGRLQYNFAEKYLLSATFRADGSSKFAESNRWGYFPSFSAGWVVSDESFMSSVGGVDFAKVRASWGQNGNQAIDAFQFVGPISFSQATYSFGTEEGVNTPGAYPERLPNEEVRWETSEQLNFGVDLRLFSNSLSVTLDAYKKTTKDWLVKPPILLTAGADAPFINGGKVENTGFEWEVTYASSSGELGYSISTNGNINENVVKDVPTEDGVIHGASNSLYANSPEFYQARSGFPIGYFWGFETDGLFQNQEEVSAYTNSQGTVIQPTARPGDVRFVDRNDDGILNDDDKTQLGNPNPKLSLGFTVRIDYKGLDFSVMSFGAFGHQIVQSYRDHTGKFSNYTTAILDRWTGEGTSNTIPRVTNGNTNYIRFSDLFIQDGDFLKIGNVTLGYNLARLFNIESLEQFRIYGSVNNLLTFTRYTGMDPDVGYGLDNGIQDKFSSGIDLGFYPNPRTVLVGLGLKF